MRHFDVIVVGGGPAGSTCAYELAKAGVDVAIFDHSHPREKPCGGGLPRRFFADFELPKGIQSKRIDWIIVEDQNGNKAKFYQNFGGVTIMRRGFDHALYKKAEGVGAKCFREQVIEVEEGKNGWLVRTKKNRYRGKLLIGADGCKSIVRKYVLSDIPKEHLAHAVGYHIPHKKGYIKRRFGNAIELYFLGAPYVKGGYIWIFPKIDYVTVGLMSRLGTEGIRESLENFLRNHRASRRIIIPQKMSLHSYMIPSACSTKFYNLPTMGKNWILIGDAAGHVNPITGEGIYYAMMDGKLAAKAYLDGNIMEYENLWRNKYGSDLYWGSRMQGLFYNPKLLNVVLKISKKSRTMRGVLADIIASRVPYRNIFNRKIYFKIIKSLVETLI